MASKMYFVLIMLSLSNKCVSDENLADLQARNDEFDVLYDTIFSIKNKEQSHDIYRRSTENISTADDILYFDGLNFSKADAIGVNEYVIGDTVVKTYLFSYVMNIENTTVEDVIELPCVGLSSYCNQSMTEYVDMLEVYIFPSVSEWILIVVNVLVFVMGLTGNALVCSAVYRNHSMRTVTNYFIVNLAVADFMVILICLPPSVLWDVTETWFFGTTMCKIVLYFQSVSVTVSVLTLTFISVDRWYAICFPLKFKSTTSRAKTAIWIIWLVSLLFNIPELIVLEAYSASPPLRYNVQYFMQCSPSWSPTSDLHWHIVKIVFLYSLPLVLMMIAYWQIVMVLWRSANIGHIFESNKLCPNPSNQTNWSAASRRTAPSIHANASTEGQLRSRRKAAKMLVAVVAMFALCYFPVHLVSVLRLAVGIRQSEATTALAMISHVLCYFNSAVNPLIYNFMSGKFRREFHRSYFKCFCCCRDLSSPDRNGTSFAPIGSSRAGTTRTIVRRNDSCMSSYRMTHLSPSNHNSINKDYVRNNTSFIEQNMNGRRKRDDSLSESARFTLTSDVGRD